MLKFICRRSMTPGEIPGAIARSAFLGITLGPVFGLFFVWLFGNDWSALPKAPFRWIGETMVIGAVFWVCFYLLCGMPWVFLRPIVRTWTAGKAWSLGIAVSMIGGSSAVVIATLILKAALGIIVIEDQWLIRIAVLDGVLSVIIGTFMGILSHLQYEAELRERKLAETAARAQAIALQAQIAPHFFFNTLNSISALIPVDPDGAQRMIGRLADVFRYTMASGREPLVPLERELEFVREYLAIEKIRYRERLRFELPETASGVSVPGLSLQPMVENAIRYGIARRLDGGTVKIEIERSATGTEIAISNQCDPSDGPLNLDDATLFRPSHALLNVRDRLKLAFGDEAGLRVEQAGDWVRATLTVPEKAVYASPDH
jgi:hypothetical protein